ncbi:MAG: SLC13 family permease [Candidatus Nanopelagicales bacterium]
MSDAALTLATLALVVVLFVANRIPVEVIAVGCALVLYGLGITTLAESLAGFADPAVLLIGALFVVSEGLDATGVTAWVGQAVVSRAGTGTRRLLLYTMLLSAGLTALIGLNGAVAALLPMTVVMAMRRSLKPSRLLMPLAFAGSAGSLLLLTGSPVNVVISEAAEGAGVGSFGFAEFALAGLPVVAGTIAIVLLLGDRLVPQRTSSAVPPDLSGHARTLVRHYSLDNVSHLRVQAASRLVGRNRLDWDLDAYPGMSVVRVADASGRRVSEGSLAEGDCVTVVADHGVAERLAADNLLRLERVRSGEEVVGSILTPQSGAAEVVIPPRSRFLGQSARRGQVVNGDLVVLAITRNGRDLGSAPAALEVGDTLLVEGPWRLLDELEGIHDVLVVDSPQLIRRQAVPLGPRSGQAMAVLGVMVVLLITGVIPATVTAMLAAGAMILLRVVSIEQAYRGISWTTLLLVAGMIPMSTAITKSGAGELIATAMVDAVGSFGPTALLAGLFVITVVFGQLISNTATALVMIPIAVASAEQLGVSARPVLMSLCVGAAVAFLTPVATPVNMMIMRPAGYRFGDYWKLGLPLAVLFGLVSVLYVPLVWPF